MERKNIITIGLALLVFAGCGYRQQRAGIPETGGGEDYLPEHIHLISTTPVKDQGNSELCWAYGMLATIESEHIMKGDSVNLSIAYIARMMLEEQALEYYFAQGKKNISLRGTAPMLIHYIDKYGAQPYDSYERST